LVATRSERRRRWFLRTWAVHDWFAKWRASHRASHPVTSQSLNDNPTRSLSSWSRFAVDSRVPSGVTLEIHRRNTTVTVSVPLTDSYVLIGNTPQCGVRLDDDAIRGIQYGLFWLNGELYGVDLRGNIPDHPEFTVADGWWTDGQSLWLGDFQLHVRGLPGRPAPMVPIDDHSMVTLHVDSPVGAQQWPLTRWLTLIGSAVEHGVLIRDAVIAPRQAALIRTPTSLWLVNLAQDLPPRMMSRKVSWSSLHLAGEWIRCGRTAATLRHLRNRRAGGR
jgi:hypothetical protein